MYSLSNQGAKETEIELKVHADLLAEWIEPVYSCRGYREEGRG